MKKVVLYVPILALFATLVVFAAARVGIAQEPDVASGSFDGWEYRARQEPDGSVMVEVSTQHGSEEALQRLVQENRRLAGELQSAGIGEVTALVTLNRPLSVAEFQSWAESVPFVIHSYTLRSVGEGGKRVTMGGVPIGDRLVADDQLQATLARLEAHGDNNLRGVISVEGSLQTSDYHRLAAAQDVFLVDVSGAYARRDLNERFPDLRDQAQHVIHRPVFWYLEDLGLVK